MKKCWDAVFEGKKSIRYTIIFPAASWKETKKEAIVAAKKQIRENRDDKLVSLKRAKGYEIGR